MNKQVELGEQLPQSGTNQCKLQIKLHRQPEVRMNSGFNLIGFRSSRGDWIWCAGWDERTWPQPALWQLQRRQVFPSGMSWNQNGWYWESHSVNRVTAARQCLLYKGADLQNHPQQLGGAITKIPPPYTPLSSTECLKDFNCHCARAPPPQTARPGQPSFKERKGKKPPLS